MNFDKKIEDELARYSSLMTREPGRRKWEDLRHIDNYSPERRRYPLLKHSQDGVRTVLVPKDLDSNKDVQTTRTLPVSDQNIEGLKESFNAPKICGNDTSRIWELENFINSWTLLDDLQKLVPDSPTFHPQKFCEIGFRNLKLMKFYEEKYDIPVKGYDICDLSVYLAKTYDYDAHWCDLNREVDNKNLDLSDCTTVVCYHVLEHIVDPLSALGCIYNSMSDGAILHVEVPVEFDQPNYEYGHVFGFHPSDIDAMMREVGFHVAAQGYHNAESIDGAYRYSRVIGIKGIGTIQEHWKTGFKMLKEKSG